MRWVDPTDPEVFAAVSGLVEIPEFPPDEDLVQVSTALNIASEILELATASLVHPAGTQVEEFIGPRDIRRFHLVYGPVTAVSSIATVDPSSGDETPLGRPWRLVGSAVQVFYPSGYSPGSLAELSWTVRFNRSSGVVCGPQQIIYRVSYSFASTITPAARQAVIDYAHEIYQLLTGNEEDCQLPERVTSIDREGIGITLATPQDFLDKGRVGLPKIDTWLSQVNSRRALRPSGVYTPDMPPGVGVQLRRTP